MNLIAQSQRKTLGAFFIAITFTTMAFAQQASEGLKWDNILTMPAAWYGSAEALRVADNVLLYQRDSGGWYKNTDMAKVLSERDQKMIAREKAKTDNTIDNDATTTQIRFLSQVFAATNIEKYKEGALKGIDFLFEAQYDNGGWPQYYPSGTVEYHMDITYNDDAMVHVLEIMLDIVRKNQLFSFLDDARRAKARTALDKGIDCILKTQIVVDGVKTAWCAQHDPITLLAAMGRSYEHPSISGSESVGVIEFLMKLDKPAPEIVDAIRSAVVWFDKAKLMGIKEVEVKDASLQGGFDRVVVSDPSAGPIWARFYDIKTNAPIFSGRDGVIKATLAEIEHERRIGYHWYTKEPLVLTRLYAQWQEKTGTQKITASDTSTVTVTPAPAQTETATLPKYYVVRYNPRDNESLWKIAGYPFVYNDPDKWQILYNANKNILPVPADPNLIYPYLILEIPSLAGEKREGTYDQAKKYPPLSAEK